MTVESWAAIAGYEGRYEVSDLGRIRSLPRERTKGGILCTKLDRGGYARIGLRHEGKVKYWLVHLLVMGAFVGPRPEGFVTRHLDGNSENNTLDNLRYGTLHENSLDMVRHGTHHISRRTHCGQGHELSGDNVLRRKNGSRKCRECGRQRDRRRRAEARAERQSA